MLFRSARTWPFLQRSSRRNSTILYQTIQLILKGTLDCKFKVIKKRPPKKGGRFAFAACCKQSEFDLQSAIGADCRIIFNRGILEGRNQHATIPGEGRPLADGVVQDSGNFQRILKRVRASGSIVVDSGIHDIAGQVQIIADGIAGNKAGSQPVTQFTRTDYGQRMIRADHDETKSGSGHEKIGRAHV